MIYNRYKAKGLVMLGVNVWGDNEADARAFVQTYGVPYLVGRDASGEIGKRFRIDGTPTTFLINRDGTLFGRADGPMTESEFIQHIDALLQKK